MSTTVAKPSRSRNVENFIVLWLDSSISETNEDTENSKKQLRSIVNTIELFTDPDRCLEFIIEIEKEKIFLIISGSLCQNLISVLDEITQLESIYIFCEDKSKHEPWAKRHRKIQGVFNAIEPICQVLAQDVRQSEINLMPISIISNTSTQLNELDQTFMCSQLLKETILESVYDHSSKKELTKFCRELHAENNDELKMINEFEDQYPNPSPIWWYTRECFLYSMLNKALRTQDIEVIMKMGFFIQHLHRQIERLHSKSNHQNLFTVYRGQGLSLKEFEKMKKNTGCLLSFNNFLSTTHRNDLSLKYAKRAIKNSDSVAIIFRMEMDTSQSSTAFVSVDHWSYFSDEEKEILFSMHTVFRIGQCEQLDDRLWQIDLVLTTDHDQ